MTAPTGLSTKAEYAYEQMRMRILDGRLVAGSLLVSESIAVELGLSTTPVREAMRRLAADNLITLTAHRDVRVKPLSRREITDIYNVRRLLDATAAAQACAVATEDQLAVPTRLLSARPTRDVRKKLLANREFHRSIYSCCGNEVLVSLLESLWDRSDRYRQALPQHQATAEALKQDHVEMAEAFRRRDADRMRELVVRHLDRSLESLSKALDS